MTQTQGGFHLFRSQVMQLKVLHNMPKSEKGVILSNIYRILPKRDQVI